MALKALPFIYKKRKKLSRRVGFTFSYVVFRINFRILIEIFLFSNLVNELSNTPCLIKSEGCFYLQSLIELDFL
jgi:hypothetical protein